MSTTSRCILAALACSCGAILLLASGLTIRAQAVPGCADATMGTNGGDELTGTRLRELLRGRGGADVIRGGDGSDCLFGGTGGDLIRADQGSDRARGGRGNDRVYARDGDRDVIRCGPGRDWAAVDLRDVVRRGNHCEQVSRRKPSGAPGPDPGPTDAGPSPDSTPPETTIDSGPTGTITTASASFSFSASEDGSAFQCKLDSGAWAGCRSPKGFGDLADGAHTFFARAIDAAGNADSTPASRSFAVDTPTGTSRPTIPGTGPVISEDLAANPDPVPLWKQIAAADPTQSRGNSRVQQNKFAGITALPDPHPTVQGSTTDTFRRFHVNDNDQYSKDAAAGNSSERAQLINNSEGNSFYVANDGDHSITYLSVRMQDTPTPDWGSFTSGLPDLPSPGGRSQILQFKPAGPGVPFIISLQETEAGVILHHNYEHNPMLLWSTPVPKGRWVRFALDIEWAQAGSITVWGDIDDSDSSQGLERLSPRLKTRTIPEDLYPQTLSVGIYQDRSAPSLWRDYANIQVTRAN